MSSRQPCEGDKTAHYKQAFRTQLSQNIKMADITDTRVFVFQQWAISLRVKFFEVFITSPICFKTNSLPWGCPSQAVFKTSLTLWPFNTAPHVVTPNYNIVFIAVSLHDCHFAIVMNSKNLSDLCERVIWPLKGVTTPRLRTTILLSTNYNSSRQNGPQE